MRNKDKSPNYYSNKYIEENQQVIRVKINRKTEPELLEWIRKKSNKQGYIKELILKDMAQAEESKDAEV